MAVEKSKKLIAHRDQLLLHLHVGDFQVHAQGKTLLPQTANPTFVRYSLILAILLASLSLDSRPTIMRAVERRALTTDL